ncbi:hypothetical protein K466DRAFT_581154 [Polyporus arcularius HHB13444]|uniref:Uncharacterized protein n=1 Tax=Polyporus arcularius HHB13444 TaxID=1314778 RepID=A0A5C3PYP1_9APHY|nr:hypothetical protein K466DRAFT_581154 [Polyporus arcularius HHB13444]
MDVEVSGQRTCRGSAFALSWGAMHYGTVVCCAFIHLSFPVRFLMLMFRVLQSACHQQGTRSLDVIGV